MSESDWMRPALDALISRVPDADARRALTDGTALADIRQLVEAQPSIAIPAGDRGDNLLKAMLALRVKFPPDEARAKLETNLAMRRTSLGGNAS